MDINDNMLTIENLDKITNCIGFNVWTVTYDTHYSFFVDVGDNKTMEVTLARHKPKLWNGNPHPHSGQYLLQCHQINSKHYWVHPNEVKDIWEIVRLIESFINEVK